MKFTDIPQLIDYRGVYHMDAEWDYFYRVWLPENTADYGLEICPDFQRGHVWTRDQQTAFLEFCLRGGNSSRTLLFNQPGITHGEMGAFVLVDGLQRLSAVKLFMEDKLPAFGHTVSQFEDGKRLRNQRWSIYIHELPTRAKVLEWYLQLNSGGTPHAESEIRRVRDLLADENMEKLEKNLA